MEVLSVDDILYKSNDSVKEYLDILIVIAGRVCSFYCGNLTVNEDKIDLSMYQKINGIEGYKKKYRVLEITEFRYTDSNCNSYLLLCNNLLFYSIHRLTSESTFDIQEIGIIDDIQKMENKYYYAAFLNAEILSMPIIK